MRTKSRELKDGIKSYIERVAERGGNCPSMRDIAGELGVNVSTVSRYMSELEECGEIVRGEFGFETAKMHGASGVRAVPVLGYIPCGPLESESECIDGYVKLPTALLGRGEFFLLRACGESMTGAGIDGGDLVLVKRQEHAEQGDIVVALADNMSTLKRFYRDDVNGRVILHPENDAMEDIFVTDCEIQGVAVKVIKDLKVVERV